jgi:hypothetical protein
VAWREQQHGPSVYKWPRGETDGLLHHERAIEIHLPLANAAEREQVGMRNALTHKLYRRLVFLSSPSNRGCPL